MIKRLIAISLLSAGSVAAGPAAWVSAPLFDMEPLELKLGTFTDTPGANVLVMALTNDGTNNNLYAIDVPPPYDGTGVSSGMLDSGAVFALGDMCLVDEIIIEPYIKDFDIKIGRYNGAWSNFTIPQSVAHSFTTTDCVLTADGLFVSGQDFDDGNIVVFRSTDRGLSFDWYGTFGDGEIGGPFGGGVKNQLVSHGRTSSDVTSLQQRTDGHMQATHFRTDLPSPGMFMSETFLPLLALTTFIDLRESSASLGDSGINFVFNGDGQTIVAQFPFTTPLVPETWVLGPVNSSSKYSFQDAAVVSFGGLRIHAAQSSYYRVGDGPAPVVENNYPNANIGGPADGCRIDDHPAGYDTVAMYALPRVGSPGIDLMTFTDLSDQIFAGKFETTLPTYYCF